MQQGEGGGVSFDGFVDNHGSLTSRSPAGSVRIHFAGTVEASCGATRDGDVLPTPVLVTESRTATAAATAAAAPGPASVEAMGVWQDGSLLPDNVRSAAPTNGSQSAGAWVSFAPCAEGTNTTLSVVVRVAISFLGVDEARHSLETQAGMKVRIVRLATFSATAVCTGLPWYMYLSMNNTFTLKPDTFTLNLTHPFVDAAGL